MLTNGISITRVVNCSEQLQFNRPALQTSEYVTIQIRKTEGKIDIHVNASYALLSKQEWDKVATTVDKLYNTVVAIEMPK